MGEAPEIPDSCRHSGGLLEPLKGTLQDMLSEECLGMRPQWVDLIQNKQTSANLYFSTILLNT